MQNAEPIPVAPNPREWLIVVTALFLPMVGTVIGMRMYGLNRFGDPLAFDPWSVWRGASSHLPVLLLLFGMVGFRTLWAMEGPYRASLLRRAALVVGLTFADWGSVASRSAGSVRRLRGSVARGSWRTSARSA